MTQSYQSLLYMSNYYMSYVYVTVNCSGQTPSSILVWEVPTHYEYS